ncbi:MAG: hypothetical protein D6722_13865 [Bacteroidetes bacterium]|nr:MAG: hypothetical protein D6722_13865 [Bacteroidota bacterium]
MIRFGIHDFRWGLPLLLIGLASGCFRPESPLPLRSPAPDLNQLSVPLGTWIESLGTVTFGNQVYVDLGTGQQTIRSRQAWDLAFAFGEKAPAIFLNTANYAQAALVTGASLGADLSPVRPTDYAFRFDSASGGWDETVLAGWQDPLTGDSRQQLWLVDLGFDTLLMPRGFRQLVIDSLVGERYYFRYALADGGAIQSVVLPKNPETSLTYFSLERGEAVAVAPPDEAWDLVFTYYAYRYPDGIPYWLTGALTNPYRVKAREIPREAVEDLALADTAIWGWAEGRDEIGFDWKEYLFGPPARYETDTNRHYLLRDAEGLVYRLRFLDFYNADGERGFPLMEYAPVLP